MMSRLLAAPVLLLTPLAAWAQSDTQDGSASEERDLGGPEGVADPADASTESDEHDESEAGRWSLSRIARGLTGH